MQIKELIDKIDTTTFLPSQVWKTENKANDIILYGAGPPGKLLASYMTEIGMKPSAFSDSNPDKWGDIHEGIQVIPPEDIITQYQEPVVIVTVMNQHKTHYHTIKAYLHDIGCMNVLHFSSLREIVEFQNKNILYCSYIDILCILENKDKIYELDELLHDEDSRKTLFNVLSNRIVAATRFELPFELSYFEKLPIKKLSNEVFVDCGAYDGSTLEMFLKHYSDFSAYLAIEPDAKNADALKSKIEKLPQNISSKIQIARTAVSNFTGTISFSASGEQGSHISDKGDDIVKCEKLDKLLGELKPTFIKMDIEGAEMQALQGAVETIKQSRPVLAICVYHYPRDLWEIPLWIKEQFPFYNLFLRAYSDDEVVLYAVAAERIVDGGS